MSKDLGDRDSFVGFREFPWENHVFSLKALSTFTLDFNDCQLLLYNIVAGICCGPLFSGGDIIDFAVWKGAFMQSEVKNSPFPTFGVCLLRRVNDALVVRSLSVSRELVFATTVSEQSHLISTVGPNVSPLLVEVDAPSSDHGGLQTVSSFVRIDPLERLKCFIKENDFERAKRFSQIFGLDTKFVRSAELFYCLESLAEAAEKLEEFTEEEDQKVATEYISLEETVQRAIRLLSKEQQPATATGPLFVLTCVSIEFSPPPTWYVVDSTVARVMRYVRGAGSPGRQLQPVERGDLSFLSSYIFSAPLGLKKAEFKSELDSNLVRKYLHVLAQRPLTTDRAPAKAAALIESEEALHTWLQTEFLNVIILHCPDALGAIATWLIDRVQILERVCQNQTDSELDKQCPFKWPSTAISWIRGLLAAVPKVNLEPVESKANDFYSSPLTPREEVRSYCSGLCSRTFGVDPFAELRSLLCDLEHIKRLLDTYQFRLLLVDCRKLSPQNIVFKMLDVTLASGAGTNIPPRIESYIKSNKLNPDQVYAAYCSEILENLKVDLDDGTFSAFTTLSNFSKTPKREEAVTQRTVASSQLIHKEVIRACIAASWIRSSVYRCKVTYLLSGITPLPWPAELHQVVDETLRLYHRPGTLPALDRVLCFSNVAKAVDILSRLGVAFDLADLRPRPLLCRILLLAHPPWTSGRGAVAAARVSKHPKEILLDALRVAYYLKPSLQGHSSTVSGAYGPQAYWLRELCSLYLEQILEEVIAVWDEVGEVEIHDRLDIVLPAISQLTDIATNFADYTGFTDGGDGGDGGATVSSVDPEGREFLWRRWLYDSCFCWLRNRLRVVKVSNQTAITYFRLAAHVSCLALRAKVCSREANLWLSYTSMMERLIILTSSSMFCPQIPPELAENISPVAGVQLARHLFSSILCPLLHSEDSKLPFSPARVSAFQTLLFWLCGHSTRDACFPLDDLISLYLFEIWLRDSQPASATLLSALDDLFQRLHRNPVSCSGKHSVQAPGQLFFKSDSSCTYWDVWDSGLGRLGFLVRLLSESLLPSVLRCCSLSGDADQHSLTASSWDFDAAQGQAATAFAIVVRVVDLVDFTAISYCFGRPDLAEFVYCLRRTVSILRTVFSKFLDAFSASMDGEAGQVYTDLLTNQLPQWLACSVRKHFTSSRPNHAMVLGLSLSLPFTMANSCLRQVIVDSPSATNRIKSITAMLVKSHCLQPLIYTPSLVKGVLDILRRAQWDAALRPYGLRMSRRDPRPDLVLQYLIDMVPTLCIPPSPTISASSSVKPLPPIALLAKFCTAFKQNLWTALLNHLRNLLCPPDFNGFAPLHSTQQYSQPQPDATLKVGEVGIFTPNPLVIATKVFSETRQSRAQEILRCLLTFLHQQGSTNPETILALRRDLEQCLNEGLQSTWPFDYEQIRFVLNALTVLGSDLIESRNSAAISGNPSPSISGRGDPTSAPFVLYFGTNLASSTQRSTAVPPAALAFGGSRHHRHVHLVFHSVPVMCFPSFLGVIDGPVAAAADAFKFFPYTTSADRSNECWEEALAADALLGPALTEAFSFLVSVTDPVRTLKFLADLFIRLQDGPPKLAFLNLIRRLVRHWNYIHSPYKEPVSSFKGGAESSDLYWINLALSEADACEQKLQIEACLHRFQVTTFWPSVLLYTPTSTALVEFLLEQASRLLSQKATRIAEDREAAYPTQHSNRRHIVPLLYDALREILRLQGVDFEIWSRQLVWQRLQLPKSICSEWVREENVDLDATAITFDPESSALLDNTAADISLNMTISSPPGALRSAKVCDDVRQNSDEDDFNLAEFLFASPWHPSSERISPSLDFAPVLDLLRTWSTPSPNLIASMQASELNRRWRAARLVLRCSAVSQTTDFPQHHLDLLALAVRFHAESARVFLPASLRSSLASHMMAFIASGDGADDFLHTLLQLANSGDHSLGLVRNLAVNLLVDGHLTDSATAARSILEGLICRQPRWPSSLTPLLLRLQEFILTDRCTTVPWRAEEPALAKTDWHAFWRSCDGVGSFGPALISHLLRHWSSTPPPPALLPHLVSLLLSWPLSLPVSVSNALRQYCAALGNRISSCSILRQLEQLVEEMSPMASARMPLSEEQEDEKENHRPPTDQEGFRKQFTSSKSPSSLTTALVDSGI
ncbi:unnamed protein product [Schistocephalus solidus]|uniref:Rod_C domain-containing protein n=1 Tax=Schistocephalus solidus TaxID=70667 RepID=A0A183SH67_SCHSO|nr:unnamed protein product [Schistocephalus solidus]